MIVKVLEQLKLPDEYFDALLSKINGNKVFTAVNSDFIVQYYQIWDKLRKEKLTDYLISMETNNPRLESKTAILKLLNIEIPEPIDEFIKNKELEIKKKLNLIQKYFDMIYENYKSIFAPQIILAKVEIKGLQRDIISYLKGCRRELKKTKHLSNFTEDSKSGEELRIKTITELTRIINLYESFSLRNQEVKELKDLFKEMNKDLDENKLTDILPTDLIAILSRFYQDKMRQKSTAIFGGVRKKTDLMYKNLAWFT